MTRPATLAMAGALVTLLVVHVIMAELTEPFFNGDETQHVMTGIFVADAIVEGGWTSPRSFAERYYAQYPALGLIVWPPGFYAVEGGAMLAFGRTFETGRWLTVAYCLLAGAYLFRLVHFTHDGTTAAVAVLVFGLTREVFFHSRNVMLEVPALAFILAAIFHLERYLRTPRTRDLAAMTLACVLAGLHRYDAVALLPMVLCRVALARQWQVFIRRSVVVAFVAVIVALAPVYLHAAYEIGKVQSGAAAAGGDPGTVKASLMSQWTYLPRTLWAQIGHAACAFGVLGMLVTRRDAACVAYRAMALGTLVFFAPLAEQETRHGIFWVPAWSALSAVFAMRIKPTRGRILCVTALVAGTAFWTLHQPVTWVRGYRPAALHVIESTRGPAVVLFDGLLSGTFVYEVRTQDVHRRVWIVRGDKVLYGTLSDPHHGYVEYAADDAAMLARLAEVSPDWIVVEEPPAKYTTPAAARLRKVLREHPELFDCISTLPVANNNREWLDNVSLAIYRPRVVKPVADRKLVIPMLWQDRTIEATLPK
jgi:hypothetical protein